MIKSDCANPEQPPSSSPVSFPIEKLNSASSAMRVGQLTESSPLVHSWTRLPQKLQSRGLSQANDVGSSNWRSRQRPVKGGAVKQASQEDGAVMRGSPTDSATECSLDIREADGLGDFAQVGRMRALAYYEASHLEASWMITTTEQLCTLQPDPLELFLWILTENSD